MPEPAQRPGLATDTAGEVELRVPADAAQLPVLRAVAATVAAGAGFDVDEIADARMLMDEICSMLLRAAVPGSELRCRLHTTGTTLTVHVSAVTANEVSLPTDGLHRRILDTLTDSLRTWTEAEGERTLAHLFATASGGD